MDGWVESRGLAPESVALFAFYERSRPSYSLISLSISGQHRHFASLKQRAVLSVVSLECDPSRSSYTDNRPPTWSLSALPAAAAAEVSCDGCE